MEGIRVLAKQTDRNMSDIVNELLRDGLRMCRDLRVERFKLPTQAMGQPRVNVADRDALERAFTQVASV